jgi:hypothetical protein
MKIEVLSKAYEEEYTQFLLSHKTSLFYHSIKYKDFLEDILKCQSHYLLALEENKISGVLPLLVKDGPLGKVINSLSYYGSHGGIITSHQHVYDTLLNEYNIFINQKDVVCATLIENPLNPMKNKPLHNMIDQRIGQFTSIGGLQNYEYSLFKMIDGNRRNEIRRAQKHNVKVVEDNTQINFIMNVHQLEMKKNNRKFKTDTFFNNINKYFIPGQDFKIFIAYREGKAIAGLLIFYFNKVAEYFTPVVLEEERVFQPMSLILYYAIIDAMRRNYDWFNWGGTWLSQEGVYRFKKQMGAKDFPYYYYTHISDPEILKLNPDYLLNAYSDFYLYNFNHLEAIQ